MAVRILAQRLELPHGANQFEVANALALAVKNTNHLVVRAVQVSGFKAVGQVGGLFKVPGKSLATSAAAP